MSNGQQLEIAESGQNEKFCFRLEDENKVNFNWLYALIDGFVSEDCVSAVLHCNADFEVAWNENAGVIYLDELKHRTGNGCIYKSVYVKGENISVCNSVYTLTACENQRKKGLQLLRFVASWLPMILILVGMFVYTMDFTWCLVALLFFVFFTIPALRKAKRFKTYFNPQKANELLCKQAQWQMENNDIAGDRFEKAIHKVLDKIFKN